MVSRCPTAVTSFFGVPWHRPRFNGVLWQIVSLDCPALRQATKATSDRVARPGRHKPGPRPRCSLRGPRAHSGSVSSPLLFFPTRPGIVASQSNGQNHPPHQQANTPAAWTLEARSRGSGLPPSTSELAEVSGVLSRTASSIDLFPFSPPQSTR